MTEATLNANNYIDIRWIPSKFHMCMYERMKNMYAQNQSSMHCPRVWKAVHNRTFWIILVAPYNNHFVVRLWRFAFAWATRVQWNTGLSPLPAYRGEGVAIYLFPVYLSVPQSVRKSVTLQFSGLFYVVFWDIDLKFGIWICFNTTQIEFEFCHAWPTLTGGITLC